MWLVCSFGREQCEVKHLCGVGNIMHFEPMEIYVRDLVDILAVGLGQYDIGDACTLCRQDLLFDSPIGSTLPRRVSSPVMATRGLGRRLSESRHNRRGHGDALPKAVLGYGSLRHVDMHCAVGQRVGGYPQAVGVASDMLQGYGGGFLHHIAEFARESQFLAF